LPADIEAVHVGKREVEDHDLERLAAFEREAGRAARRDRDVKAGPAEIGLDHLGEARVVLDEQDAVGHERILAKGDSPCFGLRSKGCRRWGRFRGGIDPHQER